jgi:hypothetical protein
MSRLIPILPASQPGVRQQNSKSETAMAGTIDNASPTAVNRSVMDRHAVKAVGDLLMFGAWLERHRRTFTKGLTTLRQSKGVSRS